MKKLFLFITIFLSLTLALQAQVSVKASIDSSLILMGDQTYIHLDVTQPKTTKLKFPLLTDSLIKGIEIVSISKPDTTETEMGEWNIKTDVLITSFDSALYYIPGFQFTTVNDTFESNPLSLKVVSIPVDTTKNSIFDIKPVYKAKINWKLVILIVLISLLVIGILIFLYIYIKKRYFNKAAVVIAKPEVVIPPYVIALQELDRIKNEKLWQQARLKEYYTDITTVLRAYLESQYKVLALEMTTDEIMDSCKSFKSIDKNAQSALLQVLRLADLVKFAKWIPTTMEHESSLNNAYAFIDATKQEALEVKPQELTEEPKTE